MSSTIRTNIIPATREAEGNVASNLAHAKELAWEYLSRDVSVTNMDRDQFISTYIGMKRDCIAVQSAYRDIILHGPMSDVDENMMEFEKKYRDFNLNCSAHKRLEVILELYKYREKHLSKLCKSLLEHHIGLDFIVKQDKKVSPVYQGCSHEMIDYLSIIRSFHAVTHKLQHLELAADSNEAAAVIATQQQQISVLDGELQESMEEYRKLKHKYNTIAGEVNKQQTMGRLQARVDVLELAEFTLRKEKKALLQSNQMLQVSEAALADQLKTAHSKFLDLKQLYEKNVADMKPQLEGTLEMSSKNRKELDMIKADVNSNMGRFKIAEAQFKEKEREAVELNKRVTELDAEVARQKHLIAQLNREVEKRTKLSLVAIASKSTAMEDLMHIEKMMGKAKIATTRLHKENDEQRQEIKDMEEYISQLQKMIEDSNKIHVELENQLAIKASELAAEVVQTEALKANQANFMAIGMSDEKQAEWEEREDQMRKMQERINKLTGQARRYQAKIEELSEQVMNLENELGV